MWQLVSSLDAIKQAAAVELQLLACWHQVRRHVVGRLSGPAKTYCASTTVDELKSNSGVTILLDHLRSQSDFLYTKSRLDLVYMTSLNNMPPFQIG